jgi:uncharacterized protein
MALAFAEIAFTDHVRAQQAQMGSEKTYGRFLADDRQGGDRLGPQEAAFLQARDGIYLATVSNTGWPYVQFRGGGGGGGGTGGSPGFIHVLDDKTIAWAEYRGNRQYISTGNLTGADRVSIIAMDYPNQARLKLWGRARIVTGDEDPALLARLSPEVANIVLERALVIDIAAFDWNCPRHIPQRFTLNELEPVLDQLRAEIDRLNAENEALQARLDPLVSP